MSSSSYINSAVTASANSTQVGAYAIPAVQNISVITTSTNANNSIILPTNLPSGVQYIVITAVGLANAVNVFPPVGGQINALGVNVAMTIQIGGSLTFISGPSNQYYSVLNQSVGAGIIPTNLIAATPAAPLTAAQSGQVFFITSTNADITITLPVASAANYGVNYKFILVSTNNTNFVAITQAPNAQNMSGYLIGDATRLACVSQSSIEFAGNAAASDGDSIDVICTNAPNLNFQWIVRGFGQTANCFEVVQ